MKVVLLAAGLGTRLRPLTDTVPKCLVPIHGKPLLDFWIEKFVHREDVSEICINLHYLHKKVEQHLSTRWQHEPKIKTWFEPRLLGTGGTLCAHAPMLVDEPTILVHADNLSVFDTDSFIAAYRNRPESADMTMMLFHTDSPQSCGIVELNEHGLLVKMHEKVALPPGNLANGAVYILSPTVIRAMVENQYHDVSNQVIPHFYGKINTWTNSEYHRDIGTPDSYAAALRDFINPPVNGKTTLNNLPESNNHF